MRQKEEEKEEEEGGRRSNDAFALTRSCSGAAATPTRTALSLA